MNKAHLAVALGRAVVNRGYTVQYVSAIALITSNRPVMEWGEVFGDQVAGKTPFGVVT